jgi:SAM-dependent methyltransferase
VSELQHPGSRSFELVVDEYERGRPEYPDEAIEWVADELDLGPGRTVVDVGAGTGKLTRALVETGAHVIAVEPGAAMLAELQRVVPGVDSLRSAAESLPLGDASVDAITAGSAFHWFRHDEALPEFRRVLRPGGGIALLWNSRDRERSLQKEISELINRFVPSGRPPVGHSVRALEESNLFGPVEHLPAARRRRRRRPDRLRQLRCGGSTEGAGRARPAAPRGRRREGRPGRLRLPDGGLRQPRGVIATRRPPSSS